MAKLPHELYGLAEVEAAKVLKHIVKSYSEGKKVGETVLSYEGSERVRMFCGFYAGYVLGLNTQYFVRDTAMIMQAAINTRSEELIRRLAEDIAKDTGAPAEEIEKGIYRLIDSNGAMPDGNNVWEHVVYGVFMGVDH